MDDVKGERVGVSDIIYNPVKKGLPVIIEKIIFESNEYYYLQCGFILPVIITCVL